MDKIKRKLDALTRRVLADGPYNEDEQTEMLAELKLLRELINTRKAFNSMGDDDEEDEARPEKRKSTTSWD